MLNFLIRTHNMGLRADVTRLHCRSISRDITRRGMNLDRLARALPWFGLYSNPMSHRTTPHRFELFVRLPDGYRDFLFRRQSLRLLVFGRTVEFGVDRRRSRGLNGLGNFLSAFATVIPQRIYFYKCSLIPPITHNMT